MAGPKDLAKRLAAGLPQPAQEALKRWHFARQIRRGRFTSPEPEITRLDEWVAPGDMVIDVGANVGHYAAALSQAVGPEGRVIAFEPVPETFALLSANLARLGHRNTTLINAAVSEDTRSVTMAVPSFETGLRNYYEAQIVACGAADGIRVLALALDGVIGDAGPVRLIKIDAEGHEAGVLRGAAALLRRDRPTLIVEANSEDAGRYLADYGYSAHRLEGSPNIIYTA